MYRGDPKLFRCCSTAVSSGKQCRRAAMRGRLFCDTHGMEHLWHIRIQRRCALKPGYARSDWKGWRQFSVWPKTFRTYSEAYEYQKRCFTFKGLTGRKMSATIVRSTRKVLKPENRYRFVSEM